MKTLSSVSVLVVLLAFPGAVDAENYSPPRGADELFWAPTLEQAEAMAQETGRGMFLMGYSLVGNGTTYTKFGGEQG